MKSFGKIFRTIIHLRFIQIWHQIVYRINKRHQLTLKESPVEIYTITKTNWIDKPIAFEGADSFCFLNITQCFTGWSDTRNGLLWTYNLNYMDFINQTGVDSLTAQVWIDSFINEISINKHGVDPYPVALRIINWIKFFSKHPYLISEKRWNSLYSQVKYLEKHLEFHLLGNHLLEDLFALYIASNCFKDPTLSTKAEKLLTEQLKEQILPDGAHYEQSPMYHCILLDRLLDCINFDRYQNSYLTETAEKMLGHLEAIVWTDNTFPLLNDSANGIAPTPSEIFDYAHRLGLKWSLIPLKECGYRKLTNKQIEVIADIGNITAPYQPGHTHADTFNYEMRINGKPFVVDTGISTYEKNARRQYERSTMAHNTVVIDDMDSSEVWGGFRVGRRAKVKILHDAPNCLIAEHSGYGKSQIHLRQFELVNDALHIKDIIKNNGSGISLIHLAPDVKILSSDNETIITSEGILKIAGASKIEITNDTISTQYNRFDYSTVIRIYFTGELKYNILSNTIA